MAFVRGPRLNFVGAPAYWQDRPELGRFVMLMLTFFAFVLLGMAMAYLFRVLVNVGNQQYFLG